MDGQLLEDVIAERYEKFHEFFQEKILCDVTLECDDGTVFSAHKLVLASASSVFLSRFEECQMDTVAMNKIKSDDLLRIVKFAYTFQVDINEDDYDQKRLLYFKFYNLVRVFKMKGKLSKGVMVTYYQRFYEYFQEKTLCDVVLECEDGSEISAHRVVLASASSQFLSMFNNPCKGGKIPVNEVKSEVLKSIVKFAYTSQLDIEERNYLDLLKASYFFDLKHAKHLLYEYIEKNINLTICLDLMKTLAELKSIEKLYSLCSLYLSSHFSNIVKLDSGLKKLYELQISDVVKVISNGNLIVESKDNVFEFIIGWINNNATERSCHLQKLMECIPEYAVTNEGYKRILKEYLRLLRGDKDRFLELWKEITDICVDFNNSNVAVRKPYPFQPKACK